MDDSWKRIFEAWDGKLVHKIMQNKISEVFHDNHISKWSLVNLKKKASPLKELNTDLVLIYKILQGKKYASRECLLTIQQLLLDFHYKWG